MTPKQVYELYLAIKLHFTSDYDFHKYKGKLPAKVVDSLSKKGGMKYDVERLSKHKDPKGFILANILYDREWTPLDYRSNKSKEVYLNWKKKTDALRYYFIRDLASLIKPFDSNFLCLGGNPPPLLLSYVARSVGAETVVILLDLTGAGEVWAEELKKQEHPYAQTVFRLQKYSQFLEYDKAVYRSLVIDRFVV